MKSKTQIVPFHYDETVFALHPDECFTVNYLGRAEITSKKMMQDEGGGYFTTVEITELWMGENVPRNWQPSDFRSVAVPDGSQRFYNLETELNTAALDASESDRVVRLPDDPIQIEIHDTINGQPVTIFDTIK